RSASAQLGPPRPPAFSIPPRSSAIGAHWELGVGARGPRRLVRSGPIRRDAGRESCPRREIGREVRPVAPRHPPPATARAVGSNPLGPTPLGRLRIGAIPR